MEPKRPWSLEGDVRELRTDVGRVQTDFGELRGDVGRLQTDVAELRADVRQLQADVAHSRIDLRRVNDRLFQMMLLQLGTLVAALASVATAILT